MKTVYPEGTTTQQKIDRVNNLLMYVRNNLKRASEHTEEIRKALNISVDDLKAAQETKSGAAWSYYWVEFGIEQSLSVLEDAEIEAA